MNPSHRRAIVLWPGLSMLALHLPAAAATSADLDVWVDLSLPALASLGRGQTTERGALRAKILNQQAAVMSRLAALGAVETGRVQQLRNALAVRLPASALAEARRIPGVRQVRPVQHRNSIHRPRDTASQ